MAIVVNNHAERTETSKWAARAGSEVASTILKETTEKVAGAASFDVMAMLGFFEQITNNPDAFFGFATGAADKIADYLLTKVSGLNIPDGMIANALNSPNDVGVRRTLGSILMAYLDDNLDTAKVAEGFRNRTPGEGERDSMSRLIGAALRLQVGDMFMDWVTQAVPFGLAAGLKDVAERFDKAMNLDDALEDIIQVPMQEVIQRGMQQHYARLIRPTDYSTSEAIQLRLQEKISPEVLNQVLANQGIRDDNISNLLDLAEPDLTESDIDQLYQHNLINEPEVREHYKSKGFQEPNRNLKTQLVLGSRRWKLEEKVFELYGNLYRDGVATREEVRPILEHHGYEPDEIDLWFQAQELERRQRKWISDSNLLKLIMSGELTTTEAISYLTLQGMEVNDAASLITLGVKEEKKAEAKAIESKAKAAIAKLPKAVRDQCDDLFTPQAILSKLLAELIALIPTDPTGLSDLLDLQQLIQCALNNLNNPTP